MAIQAATAKDKQFVVINLLPDVCLTPSKSGAPVPYPVTHTMDQSMQCSPNVFFAGKAAYLHNESFVDKLKGDEAGKGKGLVSQTQRKISHSSGKSPSVYVNGCPIVRTGDTMWINWKEPGNANESAAKAKREAKKQKVKRCWNCRKEQIAKAKAKLAQMPPGPERDKLAATVQRYDRNRQALPRAKAAAAAYQPNQPPPVGLKIASKEDLAGIGLKSEDLRIKNSNFGAQVYLPDPAVYGNDLKPMVAFKGTEMTSIEDWGNNLEQGVNLYSPYYKRAVNIGMKLNDRGADVDIVGHSLGGGQASAAAEASGCNGYTFNAAGLNSHTVTRYGGTLHNCNITAYHVAGEILTGVQEQGLDGTIAASLVGAAVGGTRGALVGALLKMGLSVMAPDAVGDHYTLPGYGNPVARHSMDEVLAGLHSQLKQDEAALAKATGKECPCCS